VPPHWFQAEQNGLFFPPEHRPALDELIRICPHGKAVRTAITNALALSDRQVAAKQLLDFGRRYSRHLTTAEQRSIAKALMRLQATTYW
jgi:hypothetical protein